jgi:dipeptidyl aminopeptidase/acylaminoacyl peptidase
MIFGAVLLEVLLLVFSSREGVMMRPTNLQPFVLLSSVVALLCAPLGLTAQGRFTIEQVLSPGYPFGLVAAKQADRIAWIEYERGLRNIYTAAAPDFEPVQLTFHSHDDGNDLTDLSISDDGSTLVYVRGHAPNREGWIANPSSDPSGAERAIWTVSTDGGTPHRVVEGGNPVLSPDGRWVLHVRGDHIYRAQLSGGTWDGAAPLFRVYGGSGNPVWSPDSRKIAFVSDRNDHSYIGLYEVKDAGVTYMVPGVDLDAAPVWSPDGKQIAFIRRPGLAFGGRRGNPFGGGRQGGRRAEDELRPGLVESTFAGGYNLSIWVADAETGEGREIWHTEPGDSAFAQIRNLSWAGDHLLFMAEPGNWRHYFSVSASGHDGNPIELTTGEGIAEHIGLSADGEFLYYSTNVGDIHRRHIWRVPTGGGRPVQLTRGDDIETYPAALASGDQVALLSAGATQPQSVALIPSDGGSPRIIAPELPAGFPRDDQVVPENVTLTAEDSVQFWNQLFLPRDLRRGERRPAVIFIHGGSRRQMLLGYHYMRFYHMAYALNQYFANKGYVVVSVNYRSGIGYGKEFRNAPGRGREGNTEYQDILAAGKYLQSRPDVDPERVGLWGLSYGGILTAQGLARNSDVFAAGVDMAGIHLWGNTIHPDSVSYQSSSIAAIDKWTSPVLLIHGDDDRNVAFSQTVGLVQLLRAHDVYHELIVFPDDVHSFLIYDRFLKSFNAADDFFDRFLMGNGDER